MSSLRETLIRSGIIVNTTKSMPVSEAIKRVNSWSSNYGPKKTALVLIEEIERLQHKVDRLRGHVASLESYSMRD